MEETQSRGDYSPTGGGASSSSIMII